MINGVSFSLIYGCSHYQPVRVKKEDCSSKMRQLSKLSEGYQKEHLEISTSQYGDLSISLAALNAIHEKDQHFTECHSYRYKCTLNKSHAFLPFIYERDEKSWSELEIKEGTWHPRMHLFCTAFKCADIFAISILPKNPSIKQTWYLKKTFIHDPIYSYCDSSETTGHGFENNDGTERENPQPENFQGGFIKPFELYYSNSYRPTIDLSLLPPTIQCEGLSNENEIEGIVKQHYPERCQEKIKSVLNFFLQDSEATHIGLLTLNPHQQWIFMKR